MFNGYKNYKLVYPHLWKTYGSSKKVRISFVLQIIARVVKLIALPVAISLIITNLSKQDYQEAQKAVLVFVGFSLTLGIITPLIKYIGLLGENKIYRIDTGVYYSKLMSSDVEFFNSNLAGYLTTATRQYVDGCLQLVRALRDTYINTILGIIFPLIVIIFIDWVLGIVMLALSLIQAIYLLWASHVINVYRTKTREVYKTNSGIMADGISNILAIKSTAQQEAYVELVKKGAVKENNLFKKRYTVQAKLISARELITVIFFMALLWLTVQRMSGGFIDITAAVLIVTYTTTVLTSIYSLSSDLDQHDDYVDKIIPAFDILNRENEVKDPDNPVEIKNVKGKLELNNVSFSYNDGHDNTIFKNLSLIVPRGQKIGIVGLSGAGKSTLTKLLLRFHDVADGEISIDGIDIRQVTQSDLRKHMAYVPQEPMLLHTSIKDNISLAKPDASIAEIECSLKTAHAYNFVKELPNGLDSTVGERGVKLSGGQKQRIVIARAVLQNAPVMILDEATSSLDSESEQIIKDSFKDILKGKTAVVIAHRLSTLSDMDRIIVIKDGQITEDGTHGQLLDKKGSYAKLWKRQLSHTADI